MTLKLLFKDELKGFYKSNVMMILWIGLPLFTLIFHLISSPDYGKELSFSLVTSSVISNIGGILASVMLSVHIIHEKSRHVYELFLIRPIKRKDILIAKFFAVFVCVVIASILACLIGLIIDYLYHGSISIEVLKGALKSLILGLYIISIACSIGVFIGVIASTVLVGIILVLFISSNISTLSMVLPTMLNFSNPFLFSVILGVFLTFIFLSLSIQLFNRQQF